MLKIASRLWESFTDSKTSNLKFRIELSFESVVIRELNRISNIRRTLIESYPSEQYVHTHLHTHTKTHV